MTALKVVAAVVLVLFFLSRLRVGGSVEYDREGVRLRLRLSVFRFPLAPGGKGEKEEKKKGKWRKREEELEKKPPERKGGRLELVKKGLPLIGEAAGELRRKLRIDRLEISFTAASDNAADAAMAFGYANMAMGMIWPIFEQNFQVKAHHLHAGVDFQAHSPAVYIFAAVSARVGQLVSFAVRFGWKFLRLYLSQSREGNNQKEAI